MKFRLIFTALAIIVAIGVYAMKGGFAPETVNSSNDQPQQAAPQVQQQQSAPAPQQSNDNGMSGFSINNRN